MICGRQSRSVGCSSPTNTKVERPMPGSVLRARGRAWRLLLVKPRPPVAERVAPAIRHLSLSAIRSPRGAARGRLGKNQLLLATRHSALTTRHSPLATHHSPLATRHSPLTTRHSPLPTHSCDHSMPKGSFFCGSFFQLGFSSLNNKLGWMSVLCWYLSLAYSSKEPRISW